MANLNEQYFDKVRTEHAEVSNDGNGFIELGFINEIFIPRSDKNHYAHVDKMYIDKLRNVLERRIKHSSILSINKIEVYYGTEPEQNSRVYSKYENCKANDSIYGIDFQFICSVRRIPTFDMFVGEMQSFYQSFYSFINNKYYVGDQYIDDYTYITINDVATINAIGDINCYKEAYTSLFGVRDIKIEHPKYNMQYNGAVHKEIGYKSLKKTYIGDYLYSTADGKLSFDKEIDGMETIPIAIIVAKNGDMAQCMALSSLSSISPEQGSQSPVRVWYGHRSDNFIPLNGEDGKINTVNAYEYMNNTHNESRKVIFDKPEGDRHLLYAMCHRFHTIGTKSGDWYIPSKSDLMNIIKNDSRLGVIIFARMFANYPKLSNVYIWSSTETDNHNTECLYIKKGATGGDFVSVSKDDDISKTTVGFAFIDVLDK